MSEALELSILDSYADDYAIAFARRDNDVAIGKIALGAKIKPLSDFRARLDNSLRGLGTEKRPTPEEILQFGRKLFDFAINGELLTLYNRLPQTHVSLKILSNHALLRQIPWEYLAEPNRLCPQTGRCVVRVIPTIGLDTPPPLPKGSLRRVLLVAAEPDGLRGVPWQEIKKSIESAYTSWGANWEVKLELETIEGADPRSLVRELATRTYDIVHFCCHGDVNNGMGRLVLVNRKTNKPDYITALDLARVLAGRGIRLVILSACESSSPVGGATEDFGNIAETLVRQGIPAVVANQAPVPIASVSIFVAALYHELLQSGDIDKAVTQGRILLAQETSGGPEWGITTLHRLDGAAQLYA